MANKPIRVFYAPLSGKLYATQHYKELPSADGRSRFEVTGKKYDVTQDVAAAVVENELEFKPKRE